MSEVATPLASSDWGTVEWFSQHYACGDSTDPTAYFSHAFNGYQVFRHRTIGNWLKLVLCGESVTSMLDVGCGTGVLTAMLAQQHSVSQAVGVDFLPNAIDEARVRYPAIDFAIGSLPTLDFESDSFDLVVVSEVLYYLSMDNRRLAVATFARILKPNGVLFVTSRLGGRYFSLRSIEQLLETQFRIEKQAFFHNRLYRCFMKPLQNARILSKFAAGQTDPSRPKHAALASRLGVSLTNPVSRFCLQQIAAIEPRLARSFRFPDLCHRLCRLTAPPLTRSNVMLLARKG